MKRIEIWLLIIILTFGLGVAAAALYLKFNAANVQKSESPSNLALPGNENVSEDLPILAFCEMAGSPEKYDGKIVRLSAVLTFGIEGAWFADLNCGAYKNAAIVSYKNEEVLNSIQQFREQEGWSKELKVIVVGRFQNKAYKDCCLVAPFQFEILRVEKMSKINS